VDVGSNSSAKVVAYFGPGFPSYVVALKNSGDSSGVTGDYGACPVGYNPQVALRDEDGVIQRNQQGAPIMVNVPMGPSSARGYRDPFLMNLTVPPNTKVVLTVTGE
jgi:hypothetical protein